MRRCLLFASALLMLGSCTATAQSNAAFLNQIVHARYIMVTTENGDPATLRADPDDRRVALEIQNQLQQWKRFILVWKPQDADIILAVRRGRIASGEVVIHTGNGRKGSGLPNPSSAGSGVIGEVGPKDDLLSVYGADGYPSSNVLWRAQLKNGLSGNKMALFEQFKKEVDEAAAPAAKKP